MSEKVLSQDEIEALFSAMSDGQIDSDAEETESKDITPYDLASQKVRWLENFDLLNEIHDRFAGLLKTVLTSKLRTHVEVDFISNEVYKYSDFIKDFPKPTAFLIFSMEPLSGAAMLVMTDNLVFSMIDCLFGGSGTGLEQTRDFTLIEQRIIRKLSVDILNNLEKAWEDVYGIRILIRKTETNPEFIRLYTPENLMMAAGFSVVGNEFSGNIYLCIPYFMLEPIKHRLSSISLQKSEAGLKQNEHLKESLKDSPVSVSVELGKSDQKIGDILNLKVGDVIWLNNGPHDPVAVLIEKILKFQGTPGVMNEKRAVQISSIIR